ncbi:MAG: carotenoid biosynthesis protein [Betaproteobacteria bacterium]|nr:MAG: carotenoid biosynthesis protein [Betaproteobacteria bacterium]
MAATLLMFASCFWSASVLLGLSAACRFVFLAVPIGWFAEQMGSSAGWFFGSYTYTSVLGPALGNVPLVIPLMWFSLCFIGLVLANLALWQQPVDTSRAWPRVIFGVLVAAMFVTAFDLGADPYFVFVLKAWIMEKTDGGWFGETVQGFVGWMFIGSVILILFRAMSMRLVAPPFSRHTVWATRIPLLLYASALVFQVCLEHPIEIRTIAIFAMGLPLLIAFNAYRQWAREVQLKDRQ